MTTHAFEPRSRFWSVTAPSAQGVARQAPRRGGDGNLELAGDPRRGAGSDGCRVGGDRQRGRERETRGDGIAGVDELVFELESRHVAAPVDVGVPAVLGPGPPGVLDDGVEVVALVVEVHVVPEHLHVAELIECHAAHVVAAVGRGRLRLAPPERPPVECRTVRAEPHAEADRDAAAVHARDAVARAGMGPAVGDPARGRRTSLEERSLRPAARLGIGGARIDGRCSPRGRHLARRPHVFHDLVLGPWRRAEQRVRTVGGDRRCLADQGGHEHETGDESGHGSTSTAACLARRSWRFRGRRCQGRAVVRGPTRGPRGAVRRAGRRPERRARPRPARPRIPHRRRGPSRAAGRRR